MVPISKLYNLNPMSMKLFTHLEANRTSRSLSRDTFQVLRVHLRCRCPPSFRSCGRRRLAVEVDAGLSRLRCGCKRVEREGKKKHWQQEGKEQGESNDDEGEVTTFISHGTVIGAFCLHDVSNPEAASSFGV